MTHEPSDLFDAASVVGEQGHERNAASPEESNAPGVTHGLPHPVAVGTDHHPGLATAVLVAGVTPSELLVTISGWVPWATGQVRRAKNTVPPADSAPAGRMSPRSWTATSSSPLAAKAVVTSSTVCAR